MKPTHKYRAKPQRTEAGYFASKRELKRWDELCLLQQAGVISDLTRERKACTFRLEVNGVHVCDYVADAVYRDREAGMQAVVEDTKSPATRTPVYRLKAKLMKAVYGIEIREV